MRGSLLGKSSFLVEIWNQQKEPDHKTGSFNIMTNIVCCLSGKFYIRIQIHSECGTLFRVFIAKYVLCYGI